MGHRKAGRKPEPCGVDWAIILSGNRQPKRCCGIRIVMRLVVALVLVSLMALTPSAQTRVPSAPDLITLTNANVVNVRIGSIQRGVTIVLRDGKIQSIGAAASAAVSGSSKEHTIDLKGRYVVPGLIDAHVH